MTDKIIRTAVVGVGYLGQFHAEKYAALDHCKLIAVADSDPARCAQVASQLGVQAIPDYRTLANQVDAVSIVVPTQLHAEVAGFFLSQGIHVLLEKPMTVTVAQAETLIRLAAERNLVLQIGHLERFNPAIMALDGLIHAPRFIESQRIASFTPRGADVNVVLDLMIHDIDIIQELVNAEIRHIHTLGIPVLTSEEDIVNARIEFENGCVANVTASRVSNKTERRMRIFQQDAYLSVNFHSKTLGIYRKTGGIDDQGMPIIEQEHKEFGPSDALKAETEAFLKSIRLGSPPIVSGADGKRALQTALAISDQLAHNATTGAPQ